MREPTRPVTVPGAPTIGYVLKGFPRLSELFIASEIYRLEQAGLPLALFVIKRSEETLGHTIAGCISAHPDYLPPTESVSGMPLTRWLARHLPAFAPALRRTARHRPIGFLRAAGAALAQAFRARPSFWSPPRKVYVKEFLQAAALADRLLDAPDVQHLHAHFCHGATTVTWLAAIISGLTFSFTAHAKDIYAPSLNPAGLLRRKLAAAQFAVTCTEENRRHLGRLGCTTPLHRVYHGLNAEFADLLRLQLRRSASGAGELRVLGVGRLVGKKGFDVLVDACAELVARGVDVHARIVGEEGDCKKVVEDRVRRHHLADRVSLVGAMDQPALYREYRRATVLCLPCRISDDGDRDGIPNVLVEALASGLPVVTTAVSGIPELVEHERTGLIVPPDDPVATADALLRIHQDGVLARRLAEAGKTLVSERFDGDRLIGELLTLFRKVA
jgi:glycosyltransferase involved in cell wall biosynthesis